MSWRHLLADTFRLMLSESPMLNLSRTLNRFNHLASPFLLFFSVLIIEPESLGDEVLRWISVGNFVHKIGVLSGAGAFLLSLICPSRVQLAAPLVLTSAFATGVYNVSWQFDPGMSPLRRIDKKINYVYSGASLELVEYR